MTEETIGSRIKRLREERGWSQRKLGLKAETSGSYLSMLEAGLIPSPTVRQLEKLAVALGVPIEELLGGQAEYLVDDVPVMPPDPMLEGIQVNLSTIRDLAPQELQTVARIVAAIREQVEREQREQRNAKRRKSRAADKGGAEDKEA